MTEDAIYDPQADISGSFETALRVKRERGDKHYRREVRLPSSQNPHQRRSINMPAFQHANIMTDAATVTRSALNGTVVGMAHFAGSGPDEAVCGQCDFWIANRKKVICDKYRQLTGDDKKAVPAGAAACRHFVARKTS